MILAGIKVNILVHLKVKQRCLQILKLVLLLTTIPSTLDLVINKCHWYSGLYFKGSLTCNHINYILTTKTLFVWWFITTAKPHKKASEGSTSWWIKATISGARFNYGLFTCHNCRFANVNLQIILKSAKSSDV